MTRKIILFEVNEIPDRVLDDFVASHPDSVLTRVLPACTRYTTYCPDTCTLWPWITWPTLHRGVNNEKHGLLHFGQDLARADSECPPVWRILVDAGVRTGVFGPLHSAPLPADADRYEFYLPDTFAHESASHPDRLRSFQEFNLRMARRSPRNVSRSFHLESMLRFLSSAPALGLRASTIASILRQLVDEQRQAWKATRRRTFQSVVAFDLYMEQLDSTRPEFSNFFTNHVASAMHRYWAARYPGDYEVLQLGNEWQHRFAGEIDFAMSWADRFFGRLVAFADRNPDYVVLLASSMGQGPSSGARVDTQLYLRRPEKLLARAGLRPDEWERRPAMDPTVSVYVPVERQAALASFLEGVSIAGRPLEYHVREKGFFDLAFGHANLDPEAAQVTVGGVEVGYESLGLEIVEIDDGAGSTGHHVPEGILLAYDPFDTSPKERRGTVRSTAVTPAILAHFGVPVPGYMDSPGDLAVLH